MDFEVLGELGNIEVIAEGRRVRISFVSTMVGYAEPRSIGMKRTASVGRASRSAASSRRRKPVRSVAYVMCVDSGSNPESLEVRKIYRVLPDSDASGHGLLRVVDDSGESYLYPERLFIGVSLPRPLPRTARQAFA